MTFRNIAFWALFLFLTCPVGLAATGFHTVLTSESLLFDGLPVASDTYREDLLVSEVQTRTFAKLSNGTFPQPPFSWDPAVYPPVKSYQFPASVFLMQKYSQVNNVPYPSYPATTGVLLPAIFFAADNATGGWLMSKTNPPAILYPGEAEHLGAKWLIYSQRYSNFADDVSSGTLSADGSLKTYTRTVKYHVYYTVRLYSINRGTH